MSQPEVARQADRLAVQLRTALQAAEEIRDTALPRGSAVNTVVRFNGQLLADCMYRIENILPALQAAITQELGFVIRALAPDEEQDNE
jgi:hypothetical protein